MVHNKRKYKGYRENGNLIFEATLDKDTFRDSMIDKVNSKSLLKYYRNNINGNTKYIFDNIRLPTFFSYKKNKIGVKIIKDLMLDIYELKKELNQYMLDIEDIVLMEKTIFIDDNKFKFIYLPKYGINIEKQLLNLFKKILDKIDYTDRETTTLSFSIYQLLNSGKNLTEVIEYINTFAYKIPEDRAREEATVSFKNEFDDNNNEHDEHNKISNNEVIEDIYQKKDSKNIKNVIVYIIIFISGIVSILSLALLYLFNISEEIAGGIIIGCAIISYISYKIKMSNIFNRKEMKKTFQKKYNTIERCEYTDVIDSSESLVLLGNNEKIVINYFPFSIGSDIGNDYVLNKKYVSKKHLIIKKEDNRYIVLDCNSTNGTEVNDKLIKNNVCIRSGDILKIAGYSFEVL